MIKKKLILTEEREAWRAINPPHEPDCEMELTLSNATISQHMVDMEADGWTPANVEMDIFYRGDHIAIIKPHQLRQLPEPRDGAAWGLRYWAETWRRVPANNQSWMVGRQQRNPIEKALAEHWAKESVEMPGTNFGCGEAQDIMISIDRYENPPDLGETWLTNRERRIMATLVQHLGTNCGRCFLIEAFRGAGWTLKLEPQLRPGDPITGETLCECGHKAAGHVGYARHIQAPCYECGCTNFQTKSA